MPPMRAISLHASSYNCNQVCWGGWLSVFASTSVWSCMQNAGRNFHHDNRPNVLLTLDYAVTLLCDCPPTNGYHKCALARQRGHVVQACII